MKGQIVLITILILSIAMTIALSLIARMNIDLSMTSDISDSVTAFGAAEAGIEQTLKGGADIGVTALAGTNSSYQTKVYILGGVGTTVFELPRDTPAGTTDTIWLVAHNADGTLDETSPFTEPSLQLCWSRETTPAAIEITVVYKRSGSYFIAKAAYDTDAARAAINKFGTIDPAAAGCNSTTVHARTITFFTDLSIDVTTDTLIMMRLHPVYHSAKFFLETTGGLPQQGKRIESTGSMPNGITRKITVYQRYPAPSVLFDHVLYSQGDVLQ